MKKKKILPIIFITIFAGLFIYSMINIVRWNIDKRNNDKLTQEYQEESDITEVGDNNNTEIIKPKEEIKIDDPYWDYIKMDMIDVDFKKLKKKNNDIVAWVQVNGTNINYPVVQAKNNSYYLNHSIDKSYNEAGWVFMDYRNKSTNGKNTILYGHSRTDTTMFGSLVNIVKSSWIKDKNNRVIKMATEDELTLWQVFSVYTIKVTDDYIQTKFSNDKEYLKFLKMLKNRSEYNFGVSLDETDQIVTLSTCYGSSNYRVVMHAKLIKRETKENTNN